MAEGDNYTGAIFGFKDAINKGVSRYQEVQSCRQPSRTARFSSTSVTLPTTPIDSHTPSLPHTLRHSINLLVRAGNFGGSDNGAVGKNLAVLLDIDDLGTSHANGGSGLDS